MVNGFYLGDLGGKTVGDLARIVDAPIVNDDHLEVAAYLLKRGQRFAHERLHRRALVMAREKHTYRYTSAIAGMRLTVLMALLVNHLPL